MIYKMEEDFYFSQWNNWLTCLFHEPKIACVEMGDQSVNLEIGLVDWMTSIQVK